MIFRLLIFLSLTLLSVFKENPDTHNDRIIDGKRIIHFSGYDWEVGSGEFKQGPGPNYFSDSEENVWLDRKGRLHLRITHRDGSWYCAKVTLTQSLGYGTYVFHLSDRVDQFDKNVVGGLFTYENDSAEVDIEFSKWNRPENENSQFVIQPGYVSENKFRYTLNQTDKESTHWFNWQEDSIVFASYYGNVPVNNSDKSLVQRWVYSGDDNPAEGDERAKMNLWLFRGNPPTEIPDNEMIVSKFEFLN